MNIEEIRQQFPMYSDVSDGELVRGIHRKFYSDMDYGQFLRSIDFKRPVDPTEGMSGSQKFLAGTGKAFMDVGRGVRQIASSSTPTLSGLVSGDQRNSIQREIDEARELEKPLMRTGAGIAGNVAGNVATFAPTLAVPGANTYTGASLLAAGASALQPVASGESRLLNTAAGAAAGAGGLALGRGLGRLLKPVASRLSPEAEALAKSAEAEGIPLTAGQRTGSRPLQVAESVMENLPLTSGSQLAGREAQQRAFTAAALRRAGISSDVADAATLAARKSTLGQAMEGIAGKESLDFYKTSGGKQLITELDRILTDAERRGATASEPVRDMIMNIVKEVGPTTSMPGTTYQAWRQTLRPLAKTSGENAHYYGEIRKALDSFFNEQIAGSGSAEAWKQANRQYANIKTLLQAAGGPGAPAAAGQLAPSQLAAALRQSIGKEGVALGRGDLNELSRIGTTFVRDQIPNSGTAQRALIQSLLTGTPGAIAGGVIGGAGDEGVNWRGGMYGAGAGAALGMGAGFAGPRLAQLLMNSPAGQKLLSKGLVPITESQREALAQAMRLIGTGAVPALGTSQ